MTNTITLILKINNNIKLVSDNKTVNINYYYENK